MKLPDVQIELRDIAKFIRVAKQPHQIEYCAKRIDKLADEISRKPAISKSSAKSRRITAAVKCSIVNLHELHPDWSQQEIAVQLGINAGRVSETLAGFRT